jgi:TonB family protein
LWVLSKSANKRLFNSSFAASAERKRGDNMKSGVGNLLGLSIIGGCLLFSSQTVPVSAQQETAEQFVERVKTAIRNDEWGRAKSGIQHALGLKPDSPEALFLAAQVYWREGARSMAIDSLNKAINNQPIYPEAHFLLARCLKESGRSEQARGEVQIAMNQGTPLFPAYRLLSEIELASGDFEAAIRSLETALRFATTADAEDIADLQERIQDTSELVEKLKQFAVLETGQKARDIVRPNLLTPAQPRYTEEARALKIQGRVSLGILVTEHGDVESVLAFRGLGHGLDEKAAEAARALKFSPAMRSGTPIPYWMKLIIEFNLR